MLRRVACIVAAGTMFAVSPQTTFAATSPLLLVNPFIGTTTSYDGTDVIDDFPGADMPFGMVQWSPDTPSQNAGGGYDYSDKAITGFSLTHLSGPGCNVFGDFGILPTVGAVSAPATAEEPFTHDGEIAVPGYYAVTLGNPQVRAELAVTMRTGFGRFTFPASNQANLLFNASSNQAGVADASVRVDGSGEIAGSATSGHFCGMPDTYRIYFVARFDRPFASYGTWRNDRVERGSQSSSGIGSGAWATFDTTQNPVVQVKIGISFVSEAGARANLAVEDGGWDATAVRNGAAAAWQGLLDRIAVSGGTSDEQRVFYTALYHALLHPNVEDDVTGLYVGFDGRVHRVRRGRHEYANFSGWDIYRTQTSLMALLAPQEASDAGQSLVDAAQQGGWLPKWPLLSGYTAVMAGDPADAILATYYAFGARDFDTAAALAAMLKGATLRGSSESPGQGWYVERPALNEYVSRGYVINRHTTNVSPVPNGASETLEYAIADFSIARFARALGNESLYHIMLKRSQNWANLLDTAIGWIAPRDDEGAFLQTPITVDGQSGFQEGNGVQYTWETQEDYRDLIRGLGGPAAAAAKLDTYFSRLNAGQDKPYAWMGNEPSIGDPFVYLAAGEPWRAQQVIRAVQTTQWFDEPQGLAGNDDLGTMSAWYVWNAMGIYPENPAVRGFAIGTPLFAHVVVRSPNGLSIEVNAPQASDAAPYVQALRVGGANSGATWVALPQRGTLLLDFEMGTSPNTSWGTRPEDSPPSYAETPVSFPPSTGVSIRSPDRGVALEPGGSAQFTFEIDNPSPAVASVEWNIRLPSHVRADVGSGQETIAGGQSATVRVTLTADRNLRADYYDAFIGGSDANGARIARVRESVRVGAPNARIPLAYVAVRGGVTPVDYATGTAAPEIPVGGAVVGEVLSRDRRRLFVLDQDNGKIDAIDTLRGNVVASATFKNPSSIALAPDGSLLWVSNGDAVVPVDPGSLQAGTPIAVHGAGRIAIASDGATLYAVSALLGEVTPVNLRTRTAQSPIYVGERPTAIAVSPSNDALYVSRDFTNDVAVVDLATQTVVRTIFAGVAPRNIAVVTGSRTVWVASRASATVTPIDPGTGRAYRALSIWGGPNALAFTPDGKMLLVTGNEDDVLIPIDVASGRAGVPIPVGRSPVAVVL